MSEEFRNMTYRAISGRICKIHGYLNFISLSGQRYAIMSVKVMLISLLKAYKFSTHLKFNELKLAFAISLRLLNKHLVTIEAR
jgi:hypothetical protein